MRKWWGSGNRPNLYADDVASEEQEDAASEQHLALGLMHLKKLFSEYSYPSHPLSDTEKEDKLYNMLPLFCKVSSKYYSICFYTTVIVFNYLYLSKIFVKTFFYSFFYS